MYTGFIYNDMFGKSVNVFGSVWHVGNKTTSYIMNEGDKQHSLNPGDSQDFENVPPIMGMDPIWQVTN